MSVRLAERTGAPRRWSPTKPGLLPEDEHWAERLIGVPGDIIVCWDTDDRLPVNDVPFAEDSFVDPQEQCDGPMTGTCRWRAGPVPDGSFCVMGDNRDDSGDSTVHMCDQAARECLSDAGYVDEDQVVGKVVLRFRLCRGWTS